MRAGGFCAIHLDTRGLDAPSTTATTADLQSRLGTPVATGLKGKWLLYSLAKVAESVPAPTEADADTFFHQPLLIVDPGTFSPRESALSNSWWWATAPEASLTISPTSPVTTVNQISGFLGATSCGAATATITATADGESVTASVQAEPGSPTPFQLSLLRASTNEVVVSINTVSESCAVKQRAPKFIQILNIEVG